MWENDGQIELDIIIKINRALQVIKGSQRDYPNTCRPSADSSLLCGTLALPSCPERDTLPVTTHSPLAQKGALLTLPVITGPAVNVNARGRPEQHREARLCEQAASSKRSVPSVADDGAHEPAGPGPDCRVQSPVVFSQFQVPSCTPRPSTSEFSGERRKHRDS